MRPTDLRGILSYTTRFRGRLFVLSVDSQVIEDENFKNLLLDVSVLRSLNMKLIIVHGASTRMKMLSERLSVTLSDSDGSGITDEATMEVSLLGAFQLSQKILEGLSEVDLRAAITNAVIAHPSGIVDGKDHGLTGRVERVDREFLENVLDSGAIPVVPPIGYDGDGQTFRVHADHAAVQIARELRAAKVIFIGTSAGVNEAGNLSAQFSVSEAEAYVQQHAGNHSNDVIQKMRHGLRACLNGVSRAHLIDGLKDEALLSELFSNEGVGTMIYANDYEAIRPALKKDVRAIRRLIKNSAVDQEVVYRSEEEVEHVIDDFYVFEIDSNVVGCVAVHPSAEQPDKGELACLIVAEAHANQGIGRKLVEFAEQKAKELEIKFLYVLSTRAFNFFQKKGGYQESKPEELPPARQTAYFASRRNSRVLVKPF
ncbi:MAG: amino-acid N-acetyltransferase [Verrucomicrobiota bacterium]